MTTKVSNGLDLQGQRIQHTGDPSAADDTATKQYVDNVAAGRSWKLPVRAASTANLTLSGTQTVDGVALVAGDRILVKDQTTGAENGIYVVAAGAWSRATDADNGTELTPGTYVPVAEGTANADTLWYIASDAAITIGTTATTWGKLGAGTVYTAGNGIDITGTTIAAKVVSGGGVQVVAGGLQVDTSIVSRHASANIGNGSATVIDFVHNLGTEDVDVTLKLISTKKAEIADWEVVDANTVRLTFGAAPASNAYRVLVQS